jgi:phytoene dehydrogenase-like protein
VRGVELASGEPVDADAVVSTLDPRTSLLELLAPMTLPMEHERAASVWRARGTTASLALVLDGPSPFAGGAENAHVTTAEDLDRLERGADDVKYGRLPERPWLDARDLGPTPGGDGDLRVVSLLVHCVPHALRAGWDAAARDELVKRTLAELERVAPGTTARVRTTRLLVPPDIEERFGRAGGHVFHGEPALDQLWFQRPSIALPRHAAPLDGLFLGGPGTHPGAAFLGGSGTLAAEAVLER